jgi:hypothetical protein
VIILLAVSRGRQVAKSEQIIHLELERKISHGCELVFLCRLRPSMSPIVVPAWWIASTMALPDIRESHECAMKTRCAAELEQLFRQVQERAAMLSPRQKTFEYRILRTQSITSPEGDSESRVRFETWTLSPRMGACKTHGPGTRELTGINRHSQGQRARVRDDIMCPRLVGVPCKAVERDGQS